MQNSALNLFRLSRIPKIFAEITASTSCNIQFTVVFIMTLRTFPFHIVINHNLTVKAAFLAIVRLCIKFAVLNVIINIFHKRFKCRQVILHIRYFHIRNRTAERNILEFAFNIEFIKSIDFLSDVNMVRICIITLIGNILNRSEFLIINFSKTIA